eukprot:2285541-Rhodomonas_salina.1
MKLLATAPPRMVALESGTAACGENCIDTTTLGKSVSGAPCKSCAAERATSVSDNTTLDASLRETASTLYATWQARASMLVNMCGCRGVIDGSQEEVGNTRRTGLISERARAADLADDHEHRYQNSSSSCTSRRLVRRKCVST